MTSNLRSLKVFALSMLILSTSVNAGYISSAVTKGKNAAAILPALIIAAAVARGIFRTPDKEESKFNAFVDNLRDGEFTAQDPVGIVDDMIGHCEGKDIAGKGIAGFVSKHYKTALTVALFPVSLTIVKRLIAGGIESWKCMSINEFTSLESCATLNKVADDLIGSAAGKSLPKIS